MHSLGFVFSQNLLKSLDAFLRNLVEGSAAGADLVAEKADGGLYDGVGIAVFESVAEALDAGVGRLGLFDLSFHEEVVDGSHGVGIYVGAASDPAGAAG